MIQKVIVVVSTSDIKKLKYQEERTIGRGLKVRGTWPEIGIDEAEDTARLYRKLIDGGVHPRDYEAEQAENCRKEEAEKIAKSMTLRDLLADYEKSRELFGRENAPSTIQRRRNATNLIWAEYMDQPISAITKQVVLDKIDEWSSQRFWRGRRGSRGAVHTSCAEMSAMYNYAKTMDRIDQNPFDIRKNRATKRDRKENRTPIYYLLIDECKDLFGWIDKFQSPLENKELLERIFGSREYTATVRRQRQIQYDAIALTLLTGLRLAEVLSLKWGQIYLEPDTWGTAKGPWFEFTKSKQDEPMGVPITRQMMPYFQNCLTRKEAHNPDEPRPNYKDYLFPSLRTDEPITTTRVAYAQLNEVMPKLAKAPKMTAQVLRKTFATTAYSLGYGFEQIGLYTGHTSYIYNPNVAMDAYVARQADAHREGFETINSAIVGELHVDLQEIPYLEDDMAKVLKQMQSIIDNPENWEPGMVSFAEQEIIELKAVQKAGNKLGGITHELLYGDD